MRILYRADVRGLDALRLCLALGFPGVGLCTPVALEAPSDTRYSVSNEEAAALRGEIDSLRTETATLKQQKQALVDIVEDLYAASKTTKDPRSDDLDSCLRFFFQLLR